GQRVFDLTGGRLVATGGDMIGIADRRRAAAGIDPTAGGEQSSCSHAPRTTHHVRLHNAKIQTIPPWLVCRARSGAKSAGGRTSAGSSDRTSPDSRNQSPPMPAYTATYCLPSEPVYVIGFPTTPDP